MKKKTKLREMSYEEFEKRYPSPLPKTSLSTGKERAEYFDQCMDEFDRQLAKEKSDKFAFIFFVVVFVLLLLVVVLIVT